MNERQRMQYMEAMGIDMFVPRFTLPQAQISQLCELPEFPANQESPPLPVIDDRAGLRTAKAIGGLLEESRLVDQLVAAPVSTTEVVEPEKQVFTEPSVDAGIQQAAEFTLDLWRVSEHLLVMDARKVGAALPTEALLSNILRACGQQGAPAVADTLRWPLTDLPGKPKSWAAAREMVASFLEGKLLSRPVTTMMLFGEESFRVLSAVEPGVQAYQSALYERVSIDSFAADALVFPSLAQLLHQPALKKNVWQSLLKYGLALC
ncbi:hypothetical protein [Teredinibacter haidensis]|uniref:hypothetical protein n=1 Tax=Teredinibacter haidensis TaxID=2731755 RepID=UPI000ACC5F84|nr:hypothetical protein [Teredinibacter haidensis]